MSNSQFCYVSQNTLLTQCVFKVSASGFNACTKTCAPLSDCCINNAPIHSVPDISNTTLLLHSFNGPSSRTTRVGRYQKGKTNLDFTEA